MEWVIWAVSILGRQVGQREQLDTSVDPGKSWLAAGAISIDEPEPGQGPAAKENGNGK